MPEEHITNLSFRKSIDILLRSDALGDGVAVDMVGKWSLDDESVDTFVARETSNLFFEFFLRYGDEEFIESESHPDFAGAFFLHLDICERCRIVADKDDREHRSFWCLRIGDLVLDIFEDEGRECASVEEHSRI